MNIYIGKVTLRYAMAMANVN